MYCSFRLGLFVSTVCALVSMRTSTGSFVSSWRRSLYEGIGLLSRNLPVGANVLLLLLRLGYMASSNVSDLQCCLGIRLPPSLQPLQDNPSRQDIFQAEEAFAFTCRSKIMTIMDAAYGLLRCFLFASSKNPNVVSGVSRDVSHLLHRVYQVLQDQ